MSERTTRNPWIAALHREMVIARRNRAKKLKRMLARAGTAQGGPRC